MLNQIAMLKHFCEALWEYDPQKEQLYIHYDKIFPEICDQWMESGILFKKYQQQYVCKEDMVIWEHYLSSNFLNEFASGDENETQFSVRMKDQKKESRWYEMYLEHYEKNILIGTCDVSGILRERKKCEELEKRYQGFLEKMPIAISSTEVLIDENEKPYDFRYTYCNPAHEKLEGVKPGELTGKRFYQFFEKSDPKWLKYYYETAFLGIPHIVRDYSPEIGKDLLIHTFSTQKGHCDCVIQDITQENFLLQELYQSREEMMRILKTTTMAVFQYDPKTDEICKSNYSIDESKTAAIYHIDELLKLFVETGRIEAQSTTILKDSFYRIKKGEHAVSVNVHCKNQEPEEWVWYKLSLFDYEDENTKERKVFGYLQDISGDMERQEKLRKQAQKDALTGILNVGAGRAKIQKLLSEEDDSQKAMLMMDVDDFKIVNDTYGHIVGDKTLKRFADVLSRVFHENAVVYRVGGDEFAVFLTKLKNGDKEVGDLLEKFHEEIQDAKREFPFLSISVGVYITDFAENYEQFYVAADKALYQTKKNKRQSYTVLNDARNFGR